MRFRSKAVVQAIGNFIGALVKTDERNFDGSIRQFFRIRVSVDVMKPLKKGMRLKRDSGEWFTVDFKYERLPTFCFVCGMLGHAGKFCGKEVQADHRWMAKPYSAALRAGSRRGVLTANQRWIAPESTVERKLWAGPDSTHTGVEKPNAPEVVEEMDGEGTNLGLNPNPDESNASMNSTVPLAGSEAANQGGEKTLSVSREKVVGGECVRLNHTPFVFNTSVNTTVPSTNSEAVNMDVVADVNSTE